MKKSRVLFVTTVALFMVAYLGGCKPSSPEAPPYNVELSIPFQHQIGNLTCAAAVVSMWVKYKGTPYSASQEDIIDFMWDWYWWEMGAGDSMSQAGIQDALWEYSRIWTDHDYYVRDTPPPPAGQMSSEFRQAVADLDKGLSAGDPTIVITDGGGHAKIVKGAHWHLLNDVQPSKDTITTGDPADAGYRSDSVDYWWQNVGNGDYGKNYLEFIARSAQKHSAVAELAEFDYWGGTYYGDPAPPDGCDQCEPLEDGHQPNLLQTLLGFVRPTPALLMHSILPTRSARSRGASSSSTRSDAFASASAPQRKPVDRRRPVGPEWNPKHAVRREIYVPRPNGRSREDVVANLVAGLRQIRLKAVEGWEDLEDLLDAGRITVTTVEHVESLSRHPDYWLLSLRGDGRPYGLALVSDVGWLLSAMRVSDVRRLLEPRTARWASDRLTAYGHAVEGVRRVHMYNDLTPMSGSADYDPLFEATTEDGVLYVAQDGSIFKPDENGDGIAFLREGRKRFVRIH